jgi:hypothetical protein
VRYASVKPSLFLETHVEVVARKDQVETQGKPSLFLQTHVLGKTTNVKAVKNVLRKTRHVLGIATHVPADTSSCGKTGRPRLSPAGEKVELLRHVLAFLRHVSHIHRYTVTSRVENYSATCGNIRECVFNWRVFRTN